MSTSTLWRPLLLAAAVAAVAGSACAQAVPPQGQGMEERLRAQLRITTTQLQQAQNELAVLKAGGTTAKPAAAPAAAAASSAEVDALKKELASARAQAASERERANEGSHQQQQQGQAVAEKAAAQVAQFRNAYDDLLKLARASEAERQRLANEAATQRTALTQCEAKNTQLYAVGQEVLHAYETIDMGSVMAAREPFAAQSRVKFEQIAQDYGDKLYAGRFDERAVNVPKPDAAGAADAAAAPAPATK